MNFRRYLPSWISILLAAASAVLLVLAFPDFELWFLAWFALVPLLWSIAREKASPAASLLLGWLFGIVFFFGSCWWLTFAPVTYAGFPAPLAYFLLFCVTVAAGLFPAVFALILSVGLRRFGPLGFLAAPFIWIAAEFARYWITGNNWNSIAYSQAFAGQLQLASVGGIYLVGFKLIFINAAAMILIAPFQFRKTHALSVPVRVIILAFIVFALAWPYLVDRTRPPFDAATGESLVVAIQPNVPMAGLDQFKWAELRQKHVQLTESALRNLPTENRQPVTVIFPESPMNFRYDEDREFQLFIREFASRNNVSVLFNGAEPDRHNGKYFNSAVMVDTQGRKIAQYDKIYLMPFGEAVPAPLQNIVPALVGSFSYGSEYDLLPLGDSKAGVMICFESHFPDLSREYVKRGADVIIEMTNDGYLGQTPVLRQHLANAVFRAVETNRPLLRVTNVGITAYITSTGEVIDPAESYTEDTRSWSVSRSDGSQTFYVRYGDWFAWLCSLVTAGLLAYGVFRRRQHSV